MVEDDELGKNDTRCWMVGHGWTDHKTVRIGELGHSETCPTTFFWGLCGWVEQLGPGVAIGLQGQGQLDSFPGLFA